MLEHETGLHFVLDCYSCAESKLADQDFIYEVLNKFPEKMGRSKNMSPYIFKDQKGNVDAQGISGLVLFGDTHLSIHSFPIKKHVLIDLFSASDFDYGWVVDFMVGLFGAKKHEVEITHQNIELPMSVKETVQMIDRERKSAYFS